MDLFNPQVLLDGLVSGLAIGLIAIGVVLVHRASRVINFAAGNMGVVGAALLPLLVINHGLPLWLALPAALTAGALVGAVVELAVIRRLSRSGRITMLIATIGVAQAAAAGVHALPDVEGAIAARYPVPVAAQWFWGDVRITGAQLTILVVVPLVAGLLAWTLNATVLGKAVTAAADNPDLARTLGISPKIVSTAVWTAAGLLSTLAMILISGQSGRVMGVLDLGPSTMVRALAAALLAGMLSLRWSMVTGIAIGVGQAVVRYAFVDQNGLVDLLLLVAVVIAVWFRRDHAGGETFAVGARIRPVPQRLRQLWWVRHLGHLVLGGCLLVAIVLPLVRPQASDQLLYGTVIAFAICAASLTVLTGWAGQLSLGQMAFAGLGALAAAALVRGPSIGFGDVTVTLAPWPFPVAVLAGAVLTALLATVIGLGALRVGGMLLGVVTFALGVAAVGYLYRLPVLNGGNAASVPLPRGPLLASEQTYYYVLLGVLVAVLALVARLRSHATGRATIAVRDNPDAAAAATVRPMRTKVVAFALSGGIAGLGGGLLAGSVQSVPLTERFFQVDDSLMLVAILVIGGVGATLGPVIGALWVVGLPAFFAGNDLVPLFASSIGLLVLLLYFPGGLSQLVYLARDALLRRAAARLGDPPAAARVLPPAPPPRDDPDPVLEARDVTVRFGGNVAVDGVSLVLHRAEIVGLIGANGAGKSTLLGALGGYLPASGTVGLLGRDVSAWSPARRAGFGLGRTFQAARLFPELTARESVLVALHGRRATERARRADAAELIDFLGLGRYADTPTAELSTGTRRIVELAGLLALDARVLCLDEPTAGVAQRETEAMAPLLLRLRRHLGAAMIVIEHDLPFMLSLADRLYCLDKGSVISEGTPEAVRSDPVVIASYLGTDTRAIARSGDVTLEA